MKSKLFLDLAVEAAGSFKVQYTHDEACVAGTQVNEGGANQLLAELARSREARQPANAPSVAAASPAAGTARRAWSAPDSMAGQASQAPRAISMLTYNLWWVLACACPTMYRFRQSGYCHISRLDLLLPRGAFPASMLWQGGHSPLWAYVLVE